MFETSILGQLWTQVASVHHEYGRLTLATAGFLLFQRFCFIPRVLIGELSTCRGRHVERSCRHWDDM